ncbi:nitrite/sulfite reductase [Phaeovulum vinaykumarii]|uniref:Sulfite reductase (NADPH) hemoprotein beta-component n=1 Tax=Phaeovulum vinaykumarii TaxID=407234 RepID=A0A1N7LMG1_9RHOB|nr:nitrite/sulfite reductase [Phaeovulum vinaykumarii]SIS74972.1 sulfite reductase (NADPH) hemoprotein beta-component [Phaeovulum vinaykumarii]SOC05399.1 sulfite reductase (NADPH) hemoprotein beta-component [Phaeovulum vinaykumarii]
MSLDLPASASAAPAPQADAFDAAFLAERAAEFRDQVARRLSGSLTEEEFRPLRLMNGLYLQLHAYMLRVAIPYGTLSAAQMRALAEVAERWDRGYGHFTTRQNVQFNWIALADAPDILDHLAGAGLHAIQTSGNCIRNVTTDALAGAAADEIADPRPYAELIRQWSTDHPEYLFLPRKFKIAISGAETDRAVTRAHDLGLHLRREGDAIGFRVIVGGGLGRTPRLGSVIRDFLPEADLLPYLEAVLSAYNLAGRRDNKYKARIKITLAEMGETAFREMVETEFARIRPGFPPVDPAHFAAIKARFPAPPAPRAPVPLPPALADFARNLAPHKVAGHVAVTVSLKPHGLPPGDATAAQMRALADLAERYSRGEIRISHDQNVVLPHVAQIDLPALHAGLVAAGLATGNVGLLSDIIACPGLDYCALATARSIPVAQAIATHFRDLGLEAEIGELRLKISGCINACAHHHLGHIGILGLDRAGVESYQVTLGGDAGDAAALGEIAGPGFTSEALIPALERLLRAYLAERAPGERFIDTLRRQGPDRFRAALYAGGDDA